LGDGCGKNSGRLTKVLQRLSQMCSETTTTTKPTAIISGRRSCATDYQTNNNIYSNNLVVPQQQQQQQQNHVVDAESTSKHLLTSIMTCTVPNIDDLFDLLRRQEEGDDDENSNNSSSSSKSLSSLMQSSNNNVRIVILDSIADLFRIATSSSGSSTLNTTSLHNNSSSSMNFAQRSALLFRLAAQLKQLSHRHQVPILVINQVTGSSNTSSSFGSNNSSFTQRPALGLSWAHCVTSSYIVTRRERHGAAQQQQQKSQHQQQQNKAAATTTKHSNYYFERHVRLLKSPIAPSGLTAYFVVTRSGVEATTTSTD
jgi:Rad51